MTRPLRLVTLRPAGTRMKIDCRIYDTQKAMLTAIRKDRFGGIANNVLAYCATQRSNMPPKTAAILYFSMTHITRGIVSHEMVHASLSLLARRNVAAVPCTTEDAPRVEENLAGLVGDLVDAFYKKCGTI